MIHIDLVGGGGQSSGQPSGDQFNWGTFGQGLQRTGAAYAGSAPQGGSPSVNGFQPAASQQSRALDVNSQGAAIQPPKTDAEIQSFIDALRRLSQAGKGASKYWYVDPRAQGYGQDAGMLPQGTQPSF